MRAWYQYSALFRRQTDVSGELPNMSTIELSNNVRSSLFIRITTALLNGEKCTSYLFDLPFLPSVDTTGRYVQNAMKASAVCTDGSSHRYVIALSHRLLWTDPLSFS